MKRISAAVMAAGLAMVPSLASAQEITLTMSHYLPPVLGLHKDFLEPWARELEDKTDGKVAVEIQTAGSALGVITSPDYARGFGGHGLTL